MKHLPATFRLRVEARTRLHFTRALARKGAFLVAATVLASGCASPRVYLPAEACQRLVDGLRAELDSYQVPDTYRFVKALAGFDDFRRRYAEGEHVGGDLGGLAAEFKVTGYSRTEAAMMQEYDALLTQPIMDPNRLVAALPNVKLKKGRTLDFAYEERDGMDAVATFTNRSRSAIVREAVHRFLDRAGRERRNAVLKAAAGMWRNRNDLPDFDAARRSWDRN